jgi:predicted ATP-dependent protease
MLPVATEYSALDQVPARSRWPLHGENSWFEGAARVGPVLVRVPNQWASHDGSELVRAEHVEPAIEEKVRRSSLIEQRLLEMVDEGTLLLAFDGERVGQVNGLSLADLGDYRFGRPVRITASAGPGRGALVPIEREADLSGHIHDKGFLTLSGYCASATAVSGGSH